MLKHVNTPLMLRHSTCDGHVNNALYIGIGIVLRVARTAYICLVEVRTH